MEFIVEIYNKIWLLILGVLKEAGVEFDASKAPEWLNIPTLDAE